MSTFTKEIIENKLTAQAKNVAIIYTSNELSDERKIDLLETQREYIDLLIEDLIDNLTFVSEE